jgi:hypothetical protein
MAEAQIEQTEILRWQDLSADDVHDRANDEHRSRATVALEIGDLAFHSNPFKRYDTVKNPKAMRILTKFEELSQKWLEEQAANRGMQPDQADQSKKDYRVHVAQPEGSPLSAPLTVPRRLGDNYEDIEIIVNKAEQTLPPQFIGAAVMYDEDHHLANSEVIRLARDLLAANEQIKNNAGTRILVVSGMFLQAGITALNSGLYFKNFDSSKISTPTIVVPCASFLEADVYNEDPAKVILANSENGSGRSLDFQTPGHVLTSADIDQVSDGSHHFLEKPMLLVGQDTISEFFKSLLSKKRGSQGAEQRRRVAEQAVNVLSGFA